MKELQAEIKEFVSRRHWTKYHSPKNLAMALSVEVAELTEIFQWMTEEESKSAKKDMLNHIAEEIGDVMIYLTMLADAFDLDPVAAAKSKMIVNRYKYPAPEPSDDGDST